uniref:Uncharacterized protein LOC104241823 n=1 Tax=Nicotiana sylvestris TaxID=4096 RepID=A0A1U7XSN9_NICSY|nr:PREDICTED: uncharacterized protein LOC104241823 [Nicotiana sylvestris]
MVIDNGNSSATVAALTIASTSRTVSSDREIGKIFWSQLQRMAAKGVLLAYHTCAMNTSKELWDVLEKKYKTEDACLKKFVVAKFLDYKMIDSKTMGTQVQELQLVFHDLIAEGMVVNEAFQVAAMIEILPPSWRDFKNYLKHKSKEMKLEDLVICLKIEEDNKTAEKKSRGNLTIMRSNIVKETAPKNPDCRFPKKDKKKGQSNIVEKNYDVDDLYAMLSDCNLVGNPKELWIDSGATRHVCAVKEAFATYSTAGPEEENSMENNATTKIEGYGKIFLKMTSGKVQVPLSKRVKIGPKTVDCVFIGYSTNSQACRFLVLKSDNPEIHINTVMESDNTEFFESIYPYKTKYFVKFLLENEPQPFKAAMSSSDSAFWKEVVNSEIQSMFDNHTWELVDLSSGNNPLGSK